MVVWNLSDRNRCLNPNRPVWNPIGAVL